MTQDELKDLGAADSISDIQRCLNCKKKKCNNCLEYSTHSTSVRGPKYPVEKVEQAVALVKAGYTQSAVAIMYGVNQRTIGRWVKRYGGDEE